MGYFFLWKVMVMIYSNFRDATPSATRRTPDLDARLLRYASRRNPPD
jgi:hypothetical protein